MRTHGEHDAGRHDKVAGGIFGHDDLDQQPKCTTSCQSQRKNYSEHPGHLSPRYSPIWARRRGVMRLEERAAVAFTLAGIAVIVILLIIVWEYLF
jgi:hypothetical protein